MLTITETTIHEEWLSKWLSLMAFLGRVDIYYENWKIYVFKSDVETIAPHDKHKIEFVPQGLKKIETNKKNTMNTKYLGTVLLQSSHKACSRHQDIDGLVQERRNSIANALELHLSCTKSSIYAVGF